MSGPSGMTLMVASRMRRLPSLPVHPSAPATPHTPHTAARNAPAAMAHALQSSITHTTGLRMHDAPRQHNTVAAHSIALIQVIGRGLPLGTAQSIANKQHRTTAVTTLRAPMCWVLTSNKAAACASRVSGHHCERVKQENAHARLCVAHVGASCRVQSIEWSRICARNNSSRQPVWLAAALHMPHLTSLCTANHAPSTNTLFAATPQTMKTNPLQKQRCQHASAARLHRQLLI